MDQNKLYKGNLRCGFTTGSCATAAAFAATDMLFSKIKVNNVTIETPEGIDYTTDILDIDMEEDYVSCAVRKDSGDDPDITSGALIYAKVSLFKVNTEAKESIVDNNSIIENKTDNILVRIDGGNGVGRVTKPGLDQMVGNAAINSVPRRMIDEAVRKVATLYKYKCGIDVLISVPEGEKLAKKTMNPKLGIEGGISILGSSGIVWPMSNQAIIETIRVEANQKKSIGNDILAVSPGNYGLDYMKKTYDYDLEKSVKCSNFIGDTIDIAVELGFSALLITGHIGKLIKLAGGIMNTHSKEGDCRMEILSAAALRAGISAADALSILDCVTTEEGIRIVSEAGVLDKTLENILENIVFYAGKRAEEKIRIEFILYSNNYGELIKTKGAEELIDILRNT